MESTLRCPIWQPRHFRDVLEDRGWQVPEDFEYEKLGDQGHGSRDSEQKIRTFRIMSEWVEKYL